MTISFKCYVPYQYGTSGDLLLKHSKSRSKRVRGSSFEGHTDGIEISSLENISFWEFGGQEVLFSTHQFFMSENTQYLLFVNLFEWMNDDKFTKNQCETLTEYWMKEIKTFTETNQKYCPPVIFIGTHCDLFDNNHSGILKKQLAIDKLLQLAETTSLHCHKQVYELFSIDIDTDNVWYEDSVIQEILRQIRDHTSKYIRTDQGFSQSGDCSFAIQYLKSPHLFLYFWFHCYSFTRPASAITNFLIKLTNLN